MGTTVTVAFVDAAAGPVVFGHVGDSRAYRLRGEALEQMTTDHSLVAELVRTGVLTPEEAERHPQRSAITRAVGTERAIDADVFIAVGAQLGDLYLLCSDGLTDMLADDEIAATLLGGRPRPERGGARARRRRQPRKAATTTSPSSSSSSSRASPTPSRRRAEAGRSRASTADAQRDAEPAADADVRTHGAGPGGRLRRSRCSVLVVVVGAARLCTGASRGECTQPRARRADRRGAARGHRARERHDRPRRRGLGERASRGRRSSSPSTSSRTSSCGGRFRTPTARSSRSPPC